MKRKPNPRILVPVFLSCLVLLAAFCSTNRSRATALLIIDVQDFYFPGGTWELENPGPASLNARKILERFRDSDQLVVHVRHAAESGAAIHPNVAPVSGEKVITKTNVNAFQDTDLHRYLRRHRVSELVICGMMTHMCVEAATRAASDLGFECTVIGDACATKALTYGGRTIPAEDVHDATLRTLSGTYATVMDTEEFLNP